METHNPANSNSATTAASSNEAPTLADLQHLQSQDTRVTRLVVECLLLITPEVQSSLPAETLAQIRTYVDRHMFQLCAELPHEIIKLDMVPSLGHWDSKSLSLDLLIKHGDATLTVPVVFTPDVGSDQRELVRQFMASPTGSDQPATDQT